MAETRRTLEIVAKVRDQISSAFRRIGRTIARVFGGARRIVQTFTRGLFSLKAALGAVIGLLAARAGVDAFRGVTAAADAMNKLSAATSTTTEALSVLEKAFAFGGIEAERFRAVMLGLGRGISDVLAGKTGDASTAFALLGLTPDAIRRADFESIFVEISRKLEGLASTADRASFLKLLFPDNFQKLIPVLGQGEAALRQNIDAARELGAELRGPLADAASRFEDAASSISVVLGGIFRDAILRVADNIAPALDRLTAFLVNARPAIIDGLAELITMLFEAAKGLAVLAIQFLQFFGSGKVKEAIRDISDTLGKIPIIGADIANALDKAFGLKAIRATQAQRDQVRELAKEFVELERTQARIAERPAELFDELESKDGALRTVAQRLEVIRERMAVLDAQIDRTSGDRLGFSQSAISAERLGILIDAITVGTADWGKELEDLPKPMRELLDLLGDIGRRTDENAEKTRTFGEQLTDAFDRMQDVGTRMAGVVTGAIGGLSDALFDVISKTRSAQEAFSQFAAQVLRSLARIAIEFAIVGAIRNIFFPEAAAGGKVISFFELAKGGVTPGVSHTMPVRNFARGGVVDEPTVAVFGEAGQEAFVPLQGGKIPVALKGPGHGGGDLHIHVHAADSHDVSAWLHRHRQDIRAIVASGFQGGDRAFRQLLTGQ